MKNWGQPRPVGERTWHGKRRGHVLSATLTPIFVLIWCSTIMLLLAKRAAYLSLPLLEPANIRSGFMRCLLHHSIPPSQRLILCRAALLSYRLSSLGDEKSFSLFSKPYLFTHSKLNNEEKSTGLCVHLANANHKCPNKFSYISQSAK